MSGRGLASCARCVVALLAASGCRDTTTVAPPPRLAAATARANPLDALSVVVSFEAQGVDSARVSCRPDDGGATDATPYVAVPNGEAAITVLGLLASTAYRCTVSARGPGGAASSDPVSVGTPELPAPLDGVRLQITGAPASGYIVTDFTGAGSAFSLAFDSAGRVRWYRAFEAHAGELAMGTEQLPDGNFTVYVGASTGAQPVDGRYIEFRADGEVAREYAARAPYYTDSHELLLSFENGDVTAAQLYGYELRRTDLTALGGRPDQLVAGHVLLRQSASGATEFRWSAWDHFSLADWLFVPSNLASYPSIDFDHPNSLARDREGNYIVSFAGLGEITRIDAATGQTLWRLGGRHNQFAIVGDPLGGFGFQHDVRVLENGDLLFFDNGVAHVPPQSRALQYRLDLNRMTATLVWEYRHQPPVFNPFVGSVQRLENGNTLVGYGAADLVTEVTPSGQVVWEGRLTTDGQPVPFFYRMRRIASLYSYRQP